MMKKSTSMLEMDELHDVIKFGEDMQALAQIDEEKEKAGADAQSDDDDDDEGDECCVARLIRQDTLKGFKDDGALPFFLDEEPIQDLRDARRQTSPDSVAFMKNDPDNNDNTKSTPKKSRSKENTDTNTSSPVTGDAQQWLESRRRPRSRSGSQCSLGASGHAITSSLKSEGRLPRNVSFSNIEIRLYNRTMGDVPTRNGIPIQLDWKYNPDTKEYSIDDYESYRDVEPRREKSEMHMPASHRQYLLMKEYGFTRGEIKAQMEIVKKAAIDRTKTVSTLKNMAYHEKVEKTRRVLGKLGRSSSFGKLPSSFMGKSEKK